MTGLLAIIVGTLTLGALYSLLASGLSLIWSVLGIFNYAHGGLLLAAGYAIWAISDALHVPALVAAVLALPVVVVVAVLVELIAVRPFMRRPNGTLLVMVATLALAGVIGGVVQLVWGAQNRQIPPISDAVVDLGTSRLPVTALVSALISVLLIGGVALALDRSERGFAIRAVEQNRDVAAVLGVSPARVYMGTFMLAAVLVCAAALVWGSSTTLTPAKGFEPMLSAFVVLVFGGASSLWGSLVGGYLVGFLNAATTFWIGLQWSPVAVFALLVIVMLVRTEGLIKERTS